MPSPNYRMRLGRIQHVYVDYFFLSIPHQNVQLLAACEWSGMFITDESAQQNRFFSTVSPYTHIHHIHRDCHSPLPPTLSVPLHRVFLYHPTIINHTITQYILLLLPYIHTTWPKLCGDLCGDLNILFQIYSPLCCYKAWPSGKALYSILECV